MIYFLISNEIYELDDGRT